MIYLSIDIEASGPFPGQYSLLSIGCIPVVQKQLRWSLDTKQKYYIEIQALEGAAVLKEAMDIHNLTLDYLQQHGLPPLKAMENFHTYLENLQSAYPEQPIMPCAWPASFDVPYIGWYFQYFLGHNPLGWNSFDIPSYGMGLMRCNRKRLVRELRKRGIKPEKNTQRHHALYDAIEQGDTLCQMLNYAEKKHLSQNKGAKTL